MRIGLVRHFQLAHRLTERLDAEGFRRWVAWYDAAQAETSAGVGPLTTGEAWDVCYCSDLPRARLTAAALHAGRVEITPLLREVPFAPPAALRVRIPVVLWQAAARAAWMVGHRSQPESRSQAHARSRAALDLVRRAHPRERVLVVSHGFLLQLLAGELRRRGFRGRVPLHPRGGRVYDFSDD